MLFWIDNKKNLKDYTFYKSIFGEFLVKDNYTDVIAHGTTLKNAFRDFKYKFKDRNLDKYSNLDINEIYSFDYLKNMYRHITGACEIGIEEFINMRNLNDEYTITDMIDITNKYYGNDTLRNFFNV